MNHACDYLELSSRTIQRAMTAGQIRFVKIGRLVRFKRRWLDAWALGFGPRLSASQKLVLKQIYEGSE